MVLLSSTIKVRGCSGKVFKVSSSNLAGTQTIPFSILSTASFEVMVVSRSEAETLRVFPSNLKRKLSKIGRVLVLFRIPPRTCRFFNRYELDTMNFILYFFCEIRLVRLLNH